MYPDAPWRWHIYLHLPHKWPSFVVKYSSTMVRIWDRKTHRNNVKIKGKTRKHICFYHNWGTIHPPPSDPCQGASSNFMAV